MRTGRRLHLGLNPCSWRCGIKNRGGYRWHGHCANMGNGVRAGRSGNYPAPARALCRPTPLRPLMPVHRTTTCSARRLHSLTGAATRPPLRPQRRCPRAPATPATGWATPPVAVTGCSSVRARLAERVGDWPLTYCAYQQSVLGVRAPVWVIFMGVQLASAVACEFIAAACTVKVVAVFADIVKV